MKEKIKNIVSRKNEIKKLNNKINELEKEIKTQDTQYGYLQTKYNQKNDECRELIEEKERLEKSNTRHLMQLRNQRLKIKELESAKE